MRCVRGVAQGDRAHPADAIFVREVHEAEVRPKQRQAAVAAQEPAEQPPAAAV